MEFAGVSQATIRNFINHHFSKQVKIIFERSLSEGMSLRNLAKNIALDRFARIKAVSENRSVRNKAFDLALDLYRGGMIPKMFSGSLARAYFRRRIEGIV